LRRSSTATSVRTVNFAARLRHALPSASASRWHQGQLSRLHWTVAGNVNRQGPAGERWIHEIKFDGYRIQVHLRDAAVKVFTRHGNDWTNRFRKIAADAWNINAGSAIIDGEVVVPSADGTTDFSVLQNELKGRANEIVMVAFDLPLPQRL
jgi:ATP-dependent DNA ligase